MYIEKENVYEKFLGRHEQIKCMTYVQFVQRYETSKKDIKIDDWDTFWENEFYGYENNLDKGVTVEDEEEVVEDFEDIGNDSNGQINEMPSDMIDDDFVYEYPVQKRRKKLPSLIPVQIGEKLKWMRLRGKKVIRFHKIKKKTTPMNFTILKCNFTIPFLMKMTFTLMTLINALPSIMRGRRQYCFLKGN